MPAMSKLERFLREHDELTRRYFMKLGVGAIAAAGLRTRVARGAGAAQEAEKMGTVCHVSDAAGSV